MVLNLNKFSRYLINFIKKEQYKSNLTSHKLGKNNK